MNLKARLLVIDRPLVMGILNLTPDSFYAGSRVAVDDAVARAGAMLADGADILDLGAASTRPGAEAVTPGDELDRLLPAIEGILAAHPQAIISVDTFHARVAEACVQAGAALINDVSGGTLDSTIFDTVARLQVPYVLMHMRGTPQTMNSLAQYTHVAREVAAELAPRYQALRQAGVKDIIIDPGFGFAKNAAHNFQLLDELAHLQRLFDAPLLVGLSRKRTIYQTLGVTANEALHGTVALHAVAAWQGAHILRVHDVLPAVQTVRLWRAMREATGS